MGLLGMGKKLQFAVWNHGEPSANPAQQGEESTFIEGGKGS